MTPRLTPLQWAVLWFYARTGPLTEETARLRSLTRCTLPAQCGPALVQAAELGLTARGRITPAGVAYVHSFRDKLD